MTQRLTAHDFDQELLILFDAYVHGDLDRRGFLAGAKKFAKAGVTAAGLLAALSPNFAAGQQVPKDDARLKTETVTVTSPNGYGTIKGYLAQPAAFDPRPLALAHRPVARGPFVAAALARIGLLAHRRRRHLGDDHGALLRGGGTECRHDGGGDEDFLQHVKSPNWMSRTGSGPAFLNA